MSATSLQRVEPPATSHLGRYEVLGELASGATGTVYLARLHGPSGFERLFAIKLLHKHLSAQPEVVQMLLKEAQLTGQIHHPHVVETLEVGATHDGRPFLVMGYVEGVSLDDLLSHPKLDAIRRLRLGIPILLDAMSGLDAVHRACDVVTGEPLGIVHHDVSPANILVGMDGIGRVADFGIASARAHDVAAQRDVVRGTPRYIAPEQARGGPLDRRSDVFALGAVLWEIITGEPLFDSHVSVEDILRQVMSATIPPPSDRNSRISETLDRVCLRALDRDLAARYDGVAAFRDALAQAADAEGLLAKPTELVSELGLLFADRVRERRALLRDAARRSSSTALRAVENGAVAMNDGWLDECTTVWQERESSTRKALTRTELAPESRASTASTTLDATSLGIGPLQRLPETPLPRTLDELLGDEQSEPLAPVEPAREPVPYALPRRHWRRWAALWLVLTALLIALSFGLFGSEPSARPQAPKPVAVAQPLPRVLPAPTQEPAQQLEAAVVPPLAPAAAAAPAKPRALRPRAVAPASTAAAPAVGPAPLLETNPYRTRD